MNEKGGLNLVNFSDGDDICSEDLGYLKPPELIIYFNTIKQRYRRKLQYFAALREYEKVYPLFIKFFEENEISALNLSTLLYELGFSKFILGRFQESIEHYKEGKQYSVQANDEVKTLMMQYMIYQTEFFGRQRELKDVYQSTLKCLNSVSEIYRSGKETKDSYFLLYNMQQKMAHMAAVLGDAEEAETRFEEAFHKHRAGAEHKKDDPDHMVFRLSLSVKLAVECANKNFETAISLAAKFMDCGLDSYGMLDKNLRDTELYIEESARDYYYTGIALEGIGEPEHAQKAWQLGLEEPLLLNNIFYNGLIQKRLETLRG